MTEKLSPETRSLIRAQLTRRRFLAGAGAVGASTLVVGTNYYIQSLNANNYQFTVATTVGGSALTLTAATLANALSSISTNSGVAGVVNKNGNTKNSFYGRPF